VVYNWFSLSLSRMVVCREMVMVLIVLHTRYTRHLQDWVWKELRRWVKLMVDARQCEMKTSSVINSCQ